MKAIAITSPAIQTETLLRSALDRISFLEAELQKLSNNISRPAKSIRIYQANRVITASPTEILYIQSENNYSRLFMKEGVQYYTSRTLKSWAKELSPSDFLRCHRTYLVNRSAVTEINRLQHVIVLRGEIAIPTSRRFQKSCLSAISPKENPKSLAVNQKSLAVSPRSLAVNQKSLAVSCTYAAIRNLNSNINSSASLTTRIQKSQSAV